MIFTIKESSTCAGYPIGNHMVALLFYVLFCFVTVRRLNRHITYRL